MQEEEECACLRVLGERAAGAESFVAEPGEFVEARQAPGFGEALDDVGAPARGGLEFVAARGDGVEVLHEAGEALLDPDGVDLAQAVHGAPVQDMEELVAQGGAEVLGDQSLLVVLVGAADAGKGPAGLGAEGGDRPLQEVAAIGEHDEDPRVVVAWGEEVGCDRAGEAGDAPEVLDRELRGAGVVCGEDVELQLIDAGALDGAVEPRLGLADLGLPAGLDDQGPVVEQAFVEGRLAEGAEPGVALELGAGDEAQFDGAAERRGGFLEPVLGGEGAGEVVVGDKVVGVDLDLLAEGRLRGAEVAVGEGSRGFVRKLRGGGVAVEAAGEFGGERLDSFVVRQGLSRGGGGGERGGEQSGQDGECEAGWGAHGGLPSTRGVSPGVQGWYGHGRRAVAAPRAGR